MIDGGNEDTNSAEDARHLMGRWGILGLGLLVLVVMASPITALASASIPHVEEPNAAPSADKQGVQYSAAMRPTTDPEPAGSSLPIEAQYAVSAAIGRDDSRYHALETVAGVALENPAQGLRLVFGHDGATLEANSLRWQMGLVSWGVGDASMPMERSGPASSGNRVEIDHGGVTEWYVNGPFGLQQGFTVTAAPEERDDGPLALRLAAPEGWVARIDPDGRGLAWCDANGTAVLRYTGLIAVDARGERLPAWLESRDDLLFVCVEEEAATYPVTIDPLVQTAKLTASDGAAGDYFGGSVAIGGDTVVVGAEGDDSSKGSAYVFEKGGGWASMTETAKLTASDGAAGDKFGGSVAIDGDTVVVGAYGDDSYKGSAYVFEKGGGWATTSAYDAKLTASDGADSDNFGSRVAIDGDTVVVGARGDDGDQGSAYVFVKPGGGWATGTETAKLTASDGAPSDNFGCSVAIDGDTAVVGAPCDDSSKGSAYVFEKGGGWATGTETAKLTASDGAGGDNFGYSVAISGDTVVVGAEGDDSYHGSAYVFEKGGGWATTSTYDAKLTASDGASYDHFGRSVAIDGDTVVVGAYYDDDNGSKSGSAYVFEKGGGWATGTETAKLTASDGASYDYFGYSVAISGDTVVVGAHCDDDNGSAYVFDRRVITVVPTFGLVTTEVGGTATFDVSADPEPTAAVAVPLQSSDPSEGTVPAWVVLPAGSIDPVMVTVTGVDDAIVDGDVGYTIVTGDPTSADATYDALGSEDVADVTVTNQDDDVHTLGWMQQSPSSKPSGRDKMAMAGLGGDQVLLFGGSDASGYSDETWVYDLSDDTWTQKFPDPKPSARSYPATANAGGDRVLLFGGLDGAFDDETWVYDLSENTWTLMAPAVKPFPRFLSAMANVGGDQVLLFGGYDGTPDDQTWVYDLSKDTWTQRFPDPKPSARILHVMASIGGNQVLLFGGSDGSGWRDETWVYDLITNTWTQKSPSSKPSARDKMAMASLGDDRVLLFGGSDADGRDDETWVYDLSDDSWTQLSPVTKPSARADHAMASVGGNQVLLFGGSDASGTSDETWVYGPGITVTPTSGLSTTETGGTATFDVSADTAPTAAVMVPLLSSAPSEGTVPTSVVLPAGSTDPVTVTVTGVDDGIDDGDTAYVIVTGDPTSADAAYDALDASDVADVSVTNQDDGTTGTAATFRVESDGDVLADGTFTADTFESGYADVAEWVPISEPVEPGDVLELDPAAFATYRLSQAAYSSLVAGVVSTQPGVVLGDSESHSDQALLALTGIVPVKVTDEGGPILPGDLLVSSSTPGHAMRWDGLGSPALIGKALEPMADEKGLILVLLIAH